MKAVKNQFSSRITAADEETVPFTRNNRLAAQSADRFGSLPLEAVIRTDERYNKPGLFQGPRGWDYWNRLSSPKDYQDTNLWPDKRPTYFVGQLAMPPGSALTIRGRFPRARYFKFASYRFERNTFVAITGEDIAGYDMEPDEGSSNPYRVGADRTVETRRYTLKVLAKDPPSTGQERSTNTIYVGNKGEPIQLIFRIYLSDEGYDGAGLALWDQASSEGPAFIYDAVLEDGTPLTREQIDSDWSQPLGLAPAIMPLEKWHALLESGDNDPELERAAAPARQNARWEIFWSMQYTVPGAFMRPEDRAAIPLSGAMEGGGDPTTVYMTTYLSRAFGPVYVFRARMPTFPDTFSGAGTMPDGQVQYWSVATLSSPPPGQLWDGVCDMMVALDEDGFYTIVVSRQEDRPSNAVSENGITWIDWGPGEGLNHPSDRKDWGMLVMRFMVCARDWENSPAKVRTPGGEESIMGPYYPRGFYTTREEFERNGHEKSI